MALGFFRGRGVGTALLAVAWVLVGGCQTPDPLAPGVNGQIRPGMDQAGVRELLGGPTTYEQAASGVGVETYEATQTIFGSRAFREREEALEIRLFSVRYDPEGKVRETLYHRGVLEGFTMLYTQSLGRELPAEAVARVRVGRTTRAELDQWLGPPTLARLDLEGGTRLEWIYQQLEAAAVVTAGVYRALEVRLDEQGIVAALRSVDRTFPTWRR